MQRGSHSSTGSAEPPGGSESPTGEDPSPAETPSTAEAPSAADAPATTRPAGTGCHPFPRRGDTSEQEHEPSGPPDHDEAPVVGGLVKRVLVGILAIVGLLIAVRLLSPHVGFLNDTWQKVRQGDPVWLVVAVVLEVFSFAGYVFVFNATARRAGLLLPRFTAWRIVLAGVAATRLLATAGAGGIASTTFALRRQGLDARHAAATVAAQIAIIYVWFILLIVVTGVALFAVGHGSNAITIIPAGIAALILLVAALGRPLLRRLADRSAEREGRMARILASIPGTLDDGAHTVSTVIRERDPAVLGGALWWLADAAALWAACHAFGASPNMLDVFMAYLIGQVANLLPIPGGLGVEAGLLGMLIAFGVPGGVAVLASLTQRLVSTWLPALPGALALTAIGRPSPDAEVVPVDDDDRPHGPPGGHGSPSAAV